MKYLIIICLILPAIYFSQDTRFTYHYKYVTDTLNKDVSTDEIVVLDFNAKEKKSVFTGLKHIISDSTMTAKSSLGISSFPDISTKVRYVIEKNHIQNLMHFYTTNHLIDPVLKVKDDREMNWEISNEKDSILGFAVQKATIYFAGRYWTAWYTDEIPISDGPYKFYGLPGLILKISDKTNTHLFQILSVKKQRSNYVVLEDKTYEKVKPTSLAVYNRITEDERKSPLATFRNKAFTGEMYFHSNEEKQKFLNEIDRKAKEIEIHDNNPIELNH
ncbi:GLPGLI family protein [Chryseobacterium gotjawalense]|uniref:GLPGLI family protein n=1 Tax=Chryseobacterium gotjawalense TaxID=3042315 RepID=A0ABY8RHA6_9FLAO|nr:GLPGLI family protein [Chryseobacterium sp. wdc7]WHF52598.1 GLPGLI family protein [Chryseobacterium sp. wdc7]